VDSLFVDRGAPETSNTATLNWESYKNDFHSRSSPVPFVRIPAGTHTISSVSVRAGFPLICGIPVIPIPCRSLFDTSLSCRQFTLLIAVFVCYVISECKFDVIDIILQICPKSYNMCQFKCRIILVCVVVMTGYAKPTHCFSHTLSPTFLSRRIV